MFNNKKDYFFLKKHFTKLRCNFGYEIIKLFKKKKIDENFFKLLKKQLIISDVGIDITNNIINSLLDYAKYNYITDNNIIYNKLREEMKFILDKVDKPLFLLKNKKPFIILVVGVNGVGKTTTIGKLTNYFKLKGKNVLLAAGDTFRAASIEQLKILGNYNKVNVISHHTNSDAAAVIFDAIKISKNNGYDILIVDTAGRLHNNLHLMNDFKKILKVIKKKDISAPHEIILVIDSNVGQNSINQVNSFNKILGLTGIILSKMDGTSKGGIIFQIVENFNIPIKFIGIGEKLEDLKVFNSTDFINTLLPNN